MNCACRNALSEVCMVQVTRDRLLRDFPFEEAAEISRETGSGYPGGVTPLLCICATAATRHMPPSNACTLCPLLCRQIR